MKKEEIHLWDIKRILIGQAPPEFLLEVFIRTLVVYIAAIIVLRWMGKRMNGQLTIIELSVMVMMGAITSVPMQIPNRGIVPGLGVLFTTLFLLRGTNWIAFKHSNFEKLTQGDVVTLVCDGVLQLKVLEQTKITNQQLFEVLRSKQIFNLGRVKRLYLEGCGLFSVYEEEAPKAGLPLYPPVDENVYNQANNAPGDEKACTNCGFVCKKEADQCPHCGHSKWAKAIIENV